MSVQYIARGLAFGETSRVAFIDMAQVPGSVQQAAKGFQSVPIDESEFRNVPWACWGANNQLVNEMVKDIEKTGILKAIIDGKARFATCNGLLPALVHWDTTGQMVIDEIVMDPEITAFLEDNNHFFQVHAWMYDLCGLSNGLCRLMLNNERNYIASFRRQDVSEMRYAKQDSSGRITKVYLSAYWDKVGANEKDDRIMTIPLLDPHNPLADLRRQIDSTKGVFEFALNFKYPTWRKKYYPDPKWYANLSWVKIVQGVPEMKAAMFDNIVRPKYMIVMTEDFWQKVFSGTDKSGREYADYTEDELRKKKQGVYDEFDKHMAGNENSYKTLFVDGVYYDGKLLPEITITPIGDTTKDGEFLPDSAAGNSEIAFSMLFNPAIIGANMPSGPYTNSQGGSNVRESVLIQVIIHELERQYIRSVMNLIKRFNGWDKRLEKPGQKLEFIIPATIPTTLDTGSNVKPMVTGVPPVNNNTPA